jgi:hypothetical protein
MTFKFSVDLDTSLDIIHCILADLKDTSVCVHEDLRCDTDGMNIIQHKHKLGIVEFFLGDDASGSNLSDYYDLLLSLEDTQINTKLLEDVDMCIDEGDFQCLRTNQIILSHESYLSMKTPIVIRLVGDFNGAYCDQGETCLLFYYDSTLKCWVSRENDMDNAIETNGIVTILDFTEYFGSKYNSPRHINFVFEV